MYLYILLIIILVLLLCNKNKVIDSFVIKTALKKCPRVWHHFPKKNTVRYYNTRHFANPEQVCLARCRDNPDCKAAQVQYGYSPKRKKWIKKRYHEDIDDQFFNHTSISLVNSKKNL